MEKNWTRILFFATFLVFVAIKTTEGMDLRSRYKSQNYKEIDQAKYNRQERFFSTWFNHPHTQRIPWNNPDLPPRHYYAAPAYVFNQLSDLVHGVGAMVMDMFGVVLQAAQQMSFEQSLENGPTMYDDFSYNNLDYDGGYYPSVGGGDYEDYRSLRSTPIAAR